MSRTGNEIFTFALVLFVPVCMALVFPYEAVGFRARADVPQKGGGSFFVSLTADEEADAVRTAKATWRKDSGDFGRWRPELLAGSLPEEVHAPVLPIGARSRPPALPTATCGNSPFLPSRKAAPPVAIPAEAAGEELAFPREELLKID